MWIDPQNVTIPFAVLAGFFSFLSPCVLPLMPAYIGYLTAQAAHTVSGSMSPAAAVNSDGSAAAAPAMAPSRWLIVLHGLFFVLGFSVVFVLIGITAGVLGQLSLAFIQNRIWITRLGGLIVIILGLHMMGVIRIPFLYYDTRNQELPKRELGLFGSSLMGFTFAAGWSPCIGPFLSSIWFLGSATGSVGRAIVLLMAYAAGLGIPFLLAAFMIEQSSGVFKKLKKHMRKIEIASGALIIVIGLMIMFGVVTSLSAQFASGTDMTIAIDEWLVRLAGGE